MDIRTISKQLDNLIKYESGQLDHNETILLFQALIDSGPVWTLHGTYARTAGELISIGVCHEHN